MNNPNYVEVEENNNYITNYQHTTTSNYNISDKINEHHQFNPLQYIPSQNQGLSQQAQDSLNFSHNPYHNQPQNTTQQFPSKPNYGIDTNDVMNARIFNQDCFIQGGLVPVNKQHIYSRNLFQEGTPIPYDQQNFFQQEFNNQNNYQPIQQQNNQNLQQQYYSQINNQYNQGYQIKKKTLYKNQLNERMQQLTPLSNKLYAPIDGLNQLDRFQIATNQEQIYNKREELNNRINSFQPMPSTQQLSNTEYNVDARPIPKMSL